MGQEKITFTEKLFHKMDGYNDSVTFIFQEETYKKYMCSFVFTYLPETKVWIHKLSDTYEHIEEVERISGIARDDFPKLMQEELSEEFKSRAFFYDKVNELLKKDQFRLPVHEAENYPDGGMRLRFANFHSELNLELGIILEEGGKLGHFTFSEKENGKSVNHIRFTDEALHPAMVEFIRFLGEESDYRLKIAML